MLSSLVFKSPDLLKLISSIYTLPFKIKEWHFCFSNNSLLTISNQDLRKFAIAQKNHMKKAKNILIINAHQYYPSSEGNLNQSLAELAKNVFEENSHLVKLTKIEDAYSIDAEVLKHEWADLVITQMPVYWFGGPWIYKKYIDEVFNKLIGRKNLAISDGRSRFHDKQYGTGGLNHEKNSSFPPPGMHLRLLLMIKTNICLMVEVWMMP